MLIFFGIRAAKITTMPLMGDAECTHCHNKHSMVATTYGRYFHIFFVPFFPLGKATVVECRHCWKSYDEASLPDGVHTALFNAHAIRPPKTPVWQGCGCLLLIGLLALLMFSGLISKCSGNDEEETDDPRKERLQADIERATLTPDPKTDSISAFLKPCVSMSVENLDANDVKYYAVVNGNKVLVLLKVSNMKEIEKSSRHVLVDVVEECLSEVIDSTYQTYIGVDGTWNMLMTKTPAGADLGGSFADEEDLLPFYGPDATKNKK